MIYKARNYQDVITLIDKTDNYHLAHAILRAMFAFEVDHEQDRTDGFA